MQIKFTNKPTYAEEGQPNPLRWCILSGTPETGFTNETSWLRCKDFFNDYVVAYNGGKRFSIYGLSTENMNIAPKGAPVYIALNALSSAFKNNLGVFNSWLNGQDIPVINMLTVDKYYVLEFPEYYFKNTYNISLVSLIIRLLNVDEKFEDFGDVISHKGFAQKDQQKWNVVVQAGIYFNIPEKLNKYIWYIDADNNSEKGAVNEYNFSSLVHNGGTLQWHSIMKGMS